MATAMLFLLVSLFLILVTGLAIWLSYLVLGPSKYTGPLAGSGKGRVSAHVLVLGDIGRSPRMTYHALSLAKHGGKVNLIGYLDVVNNPNITVTPIPSPPGRPPSIPFILFAPIKVVYQVYHLVRLLAYRLPPAQWILVQNPPSIPTLAIASLICRLRGSKLMIDWHNYGWTILAGTRGANHPLVHLSKLYECYFGRLGSVHLTVTDAMARQLRQAPYLIKREMVAVHDRPATIFRPLSSASARAEILTRVLPESERVLLPSLFDGTTRLLVSSTSWTPDEDFSLLLDALTEYAVVAPAPVLAIITGKGPQKGMYLERIGELTVAGRLPNVRITTAFLPFADYAALLACADLGICLHMSSSGVDLPMKVVDMFGAGLPVAAYSGYESFSELVRDGDNGRGFETAAELAAILTRLLGSRGRSELEALRRGAVAEGSRRWDAEWDAKVGAIMGLGPASRG